MLLHAPLQDSTASGGCKLTCLAAPLWLVLCCNCQRSSCCCSLRPSRGLPATQGAARCGVGAEGAEAACHVFSALHCLLAGSALHACCHSCQGGGNFAAHLLGRHPQGCCCRARCWLPRPQKAPLHLQERLARGCSQLARLERALRLLRRSHRQCSGGSVTPPGPSRRSPRSAPSHALRLILCAKRALSLSCLLGGCRILRPTCGHRQGHCPVRTFRQPPRGHSQCRCRRVKPRLLGHPGCRMGGRMQCDGERLRGPW
mmetsp:Transcript_56420/g.174946  ORF Transcript_56420/g.174946 Transcript_56420/m.174946 type:complete len:258 (+) Transcript_56420:1500-2273(+)